MLVEFSWRLLLFFVVVGILQTTLDVIALAAWRSFVRKKGWKCGDVFCFSLYGLFAPSRVVPQPFE
jgi:hypothetical protein